MDSVQPLRIAKSTPSSSPSKMPVATSRPLAEIGSTERRRNSPSYNQATRKMIVSRETSPYTENSSPPSFIKQAPRDYWATKDAMSPSRFDTENSPAPDASPMLASPKRRPSVERLMQASRVKNSNIFALESKDAYDPTTLPIVERPSANRPLSQSVANNSFALLDSAQKENNPLRSPGKSGHKRSESRTELPFLTPTKIAATVPLPTSPEKQGSPSPTKSSFARTSQFGVPSFDAAGSELSDGERALTPRHAKSVTFHEAPPVVNEYEEQTPEPSMSIASDHEGDWDSDDFDDQDMSFERGSSLEPDREDSFDEDLENADKTPVVLPDDWSRMSPDEARTDLVNPADDVFDGDDMTVRGLPARVASDSETRPLPPLPAFMKHERSGSDSLTSTAERAANVARNQHNSTKAPFCSKEELLQIVKKSSTTTTQTSSAEVANEQSAQAMPQSQRCVSSEELIVTNLDTGVQVQVKVKESEVTEDSLVGDLSEFTKAPRISRESILRRVRDSKYDFEDFDGEDDVEESEMASDRDDNARPTIAEMARMDPDQPVPSRENSRETSDTYLIARDTIPEQMVNIKEEPVDHNDFDMSSIPAATTVENAGAPVFSGVDDYDRQSSVLRNGRAMVDETDETDASSRYSSMEPDAECSMIHIHQQTVEQDDGKETLQDAMQLLSVKDYSSESKKQGSLADDFLGLPAYLSTDDFDFGMKDFITPSPSAIASSAPARTLDSSAMPILQPPVTLQRDAGLNASSHEALEASPRTSAESVIRHGANVPAPVEGPKEKPKHIVSCQTDTVDIPERMVSIKTPGGKLKARPSATPADLAAMAEQRRAVSIERSVPSEPEPPAIAAPETVAAPEPTKRPTSSSSDQQQKAAGQSPQKNRRKSRKSGGRMDLSFLDASTFSIGDEEQQGLGLDEDFDRLMDAQKKGYLMRQNTKIVVASTRSVSGGSSGTAESGATITAEDAVRPMSSANEEPARPSSRAAKSATSSPRKASEEQFLKTEPWNGKVRRKSVRLASAQNAPAPPLPGFESALGVVNEDYAAGSSSLEDDIGEGIERGRLFVKVVGAKNLDLPLPRNDRVYFQLTLDNGLHCVTTASLELGSNAPIGQEFELVVLNDLEFQLTLSTKLPPPAQQTPPSSSGSLSRSPAKSQKSSGFSRFLSSPKKRAEKERQEREAAEAEHQRLQEEAQRKRRSQAPSSWDLMRELVNSSDGSFARAYVNLNAHEKFCFGRQFAVDVPCYNEWALENDFQVVNSVRSKRGTSSGPVRRPPYVIGQLQLQLLYVPKPKHATENDMPKSMSAAIREMKKAGESTEMVHEGHLSQQGGDCTHWRRRFFRLQGSKLTAYHEHTHQKRAVINLSKASRLVDDKRMLAADHSPVKGKGRRKSAFAEEDEAYQYVEEGFRMRFANGETIDFYAESKAKKDEWMGVLGQVIGKPDSNQKAATWTDLVLARERAGGRPESASSMSSPTKAGAAEVRDFGKTVNGDRRSADMTSSAMLTAKSAPTSPVKAPPLRQAPFPLAPASTARPRTPPMSPRKGHRSRDAVKSMIF